MHNSSSEPLFTTAIDQQISSDLIMSHKLNESLNNIQSENDTLSHVPRTIPSQEEDANTIPRLWSDEPECNNDCCTTGFIKVRRSRAQRWKPNCDKQLEKRIKDAEIWNSVNHRDLSEFEYLMVVYATKGAVGGLFRSIS